MSSTKWVDLTLPANLFSNDRQHWGAHWVGRLEPRFSEEYKLEFIMASSHDDLYKGYGRLAVNADIHTCGKLPSSFPGKYYFN